jgi:hypothetical protein
MFREEPLGVLRRRPGCRQADKRHKQHLR